MRRQQMIDYYALKSWRMASVLRQYTKRDSIIYNLGIGARVVRHADEAVLNEIWNEDAGRARTAVWRTASLL
jgi:hypothetical protein